MKIKAFNIRWDTSDDDSDESVELPSDLVVDVDAEEYADDPDEAVSDALSAATGFCHFGFDHEPVQN